MSLTQLFRYVKLIGLFGLAIWLLQACGNIVPIWSGEKNLNTQALYYADEPVEFNINISPEKGDTIDLMLELEVTYDASHINREELPLKIFLEPKGSKELKRFPLKEYQVNIPLKIEGEWVGMPDQYGVDYVLTWPAIQSEQFFPGKYTLKIYSNDKHQAEKILGVIKIAARLYDRNGMVEEIKE